mgnify:CR=1 FL=1
MITFQQKKESYFCSPVQGGSAVSGQVPLQLSQCGKVQTTLHTHVLLAFLMLQLVGTELTGVGEASATHAAAAGASTGD